MKKNLFIFLFLIAILSINVLAKTYDDADKLYQKGKYQEAYDIYKELLQGEEDNEIRFKSFYRAAECLAYLYRYGKATDLVINTKIPDDLEYKARFLILRSELLQNFIKQYSSIMSKDIIEDDTEQDVFSLTESEIENIIRESYKSLWGLRYVLVSMKLEDENFYLDVKNTDFGRFPTLFDYVSMRWISYLKQKSKSTFLDAFDLLKDKDTVILRDDLSDVEKIVAIMRISETYMVHKRLEASERWKIERMKFPLYSNYFKYDAEKYKDMLIKRLLESVDEFKTDTASAQSGFEAASLENGRGNYVKAVEICESIIDKYSGNYFAISCQKLLEQIKRPQLSMSVKNSLEPGTDSIDITSRNLKKVNFRLYKVDPYEIKRYRLGKDKYRSDIEWSSVLSSPYKDYFIDELLTRRDFVEFSRNTGDKGDYKYYQNTFSPPEIKNGLYVIALSDEDFTPEKDIIRFSFLNISDVFIVSSSGFTDRTRVAFNDYLDNNRTKNITDEVIRLYALDARTGERLENYTVDSFINKMNRDSYNEKIDVKSQPYKGYDLNDINISPFHNSYLYVNPLVKKGDSFSWLNGSVSFSDGMPGLIEIFLFTDRAIYRPGDKVFYKAVAVRKTSQGYKTINKGMKLDVAVRDVNYKSIFNQSLKTDEFGAVEGEFVIDKDRLLGNYNIQINCVYRGRGYSKSRSFSVEEYKRPEFEVVVDDAKAPWRLEKETNITGTVKYYFGAAVSNTQIEYKIKRRKYIPWYFRWWYSVSSSEEEIQTGTVKTDEKGKFNIKFTPFISESSPYKWIPNISDFIVEIVAKDEGGRTIKGNNTFRAGKVGSYVTIENEENFYFTGEKENLNIGLFTINDTPQDGEVFVEIFKLDTDQLKKEQAENANLETQMINLEDKKLVLSERLSVKDGKGKISTDLEKAGVYRIRASYKDKWGEKVQAQRILLILKDSNQEQPFRTGPIMISKKDEYLPGEQAIILLGNSFGGKNWTIECWNKKFLDKTLRSNIELGVIKLPILEKYRRGISLKAFSVYKNRLDDMKLDLNVAWPEKNLNIITENFKDRVEPGSQNSVKLKISGNNSDVQLSALMYDESLDYYRKNDIGWLESLYTPQFSYIRSNSTDLNPSIGSISVKNSLLSSIVGLFKNQKNYRIPGIRAWNTWYGGYSRRGFGGNILNMKKSVMVESAVPEGFAQDEMVMADAELKEKSDVQRQSIPNKAPETKIRSEFADTAFFIPDIKTKNGIASFDYKAPDQLTRWKMNIFAHSKDAAFASLKKTLKTAKDLMVRVDAPRFFREKDITTVDVFVHNETDISTSGYMQLDVTMDGKEASKDLGIEKTRFSFNIPAHDRKVFSFKVNVPAKIGEYSFTAKAWNDKTSDAQQNKIPVYTSRERIMESVFVALKDSVEKVLKTKASEDDSVILEQAVLEVEPQLILNVMNSIPYLVDYPYSCVEQTLNRFIPLSIMGQIYEKYPFLSEAVYKVKQRDTIDNPWDSDDPRRQKDLAETPWLRQSKGRKTSYDMINLLRPGVVSLQSKKALSRLKMSQNSDGGFPWFPGGRSDTYITLYVLAGFVEAMRYDVEVPEDIIKGALRYVQSELSKKYKKHTRYYSLGVYGAYIISEYIKQDYYYAKKMSSLVNKMLKIGEEEIHALTPLGKAYMAYAYFNTGNKKRADVVLDMALDGWREDPVTGVYWTPEEYSWIWYSDTIEKHAFFLRTLLTLRPNDKKIPGMVRWLLFNRQGNEWKSTKASVAAIFSIIEYMEKTGSFDQRNDYKISWGDENIRFSLQPDDYVEEPLLWVKKGQLLDKGYLKAKIKKDGPGTAFASLHLTYTTDSLPDRSAPGLINIERKYYRRVKDGENYVLKRIKNGDNVKVGEELEVHLIFNTRHQFEYVQLKEPKGSGFELETLLSGWKWDPIRYYEEPRDTMVNFFIDWLPHGEYKLKYRLRATKPGKYRIGAASLQSMYAPEFAGHSAGIIIEVKK